MSKGILVVLCLVSLTLIAGLSVLLYVFASPPRPQDGSMNTYSSLFYGVTFQYPKNYFVVEHEVGNSERASHSIVIVPDTQTNRDLISGKIQNSDGPATITLQILQNSLDHYSIENWVRNTNASNYKLSPDGLLSSETLAGEDALRYRWSGLYEGTTVAVARPDWIYAFSVSYDSKDDQITKDFEQILTTIRFAATE